MRRLRDVLAGSAIAATLDGALPKGRAIVLASGSRATLVRTLPWMAGQHADAIRASIQAHDPHSASTLEDAYVSLASVQAAEKVKEGTGVRRRRPIGGAPIE